MVVLIYLLVMFGYENVVGTRAENHAKTIADLTFNSLFQVMRKGGGERDVSDLLAANKKLLTGTDMSVVLYQSKGFAEQNG